MANMQGQYNEPETGRKIVTELQVMDLGVEHAQYFQGAGVADTGWEEVYVGVGMSAREAGEDAAENLYQVWEVPPEIEPLLNNELEQLSDEEDVPLESEVEEHGHVPTEEEETAETGIEEEYEENGMEPAEEVYHYVAIFVK